MSLLNTVYRENLKQNCKNFQQAVFFLDDLAILISCSHCCSSKILKSYLNNYFDFHVCLSIRSSVRPCVCLKISSISCSRMTKCH